MNAPVAVRHVTILVASILFLTPILSCRSSRALEPAQPGPLPKAPDLIVRWLDDETLAQLHEDFEWQGIRVPKGFIFDGASIPSAVQSFEGRWGTGVKAAVLNDWLYTTHAVSKSEADEILFRSLIHLGVPKMKARMMHQAVRMFGKKAWEQRSAFGLANRPDLVEHNLALENLMEHAGSDPKPDH